MSTGWPVALPGWVLPVKVWRKGEIKFDLGQGLKRGLEAERLRG